MISIDKSIEEYSKKAKPERICSIDTFNDKEFSKLIEMFENSFEQYQCYQHDYFLHCLTTLSESKLSFSPNSIKLFSNTLKSYKNIEDYAGLFISALISSSNSNIFEINIEPDVEVNFIGGFFGVPYRMNDYEKMKNKKLTVYGNPGVCSGYCMAAGLVDIIGDSDYGPGYEMSGGILLIRGSVGNGCGYMQRSGTIVVLGNAGTVGEMQDTGTIMVKGDVVSIGYLAQGYILVEGNIGKIGDFHGILGNKGVYLSNPLKGKTYNFDKLISDIYKPV